MKTDKFQVEKILLDEPYKTISKVLYNGKHYIIKKFYQHDNYAVYEKLMNYQHNNICAFYDLVQDEEGFTVREEYLGDTTLNNMIPITDISIFYNIAFQLCNALMYLHSFNIVHRDLKPENIFYINGRVVLNDFDISKTVIESGNKNKDTQVLGSVGFASPEQYGFMKSDYRSDIYSLGVVFNVLLTGSLITDKLADEPIKTIILKCTELDRNKRYQSIKELKEALVNIKKKRFKYMPPGFRSGKPIKMVIASVVYLLIVLMVIGVKSADGITSYDHFKSKVIVLVFFVPIIWVGTNYLDVYSLLSYPLRKKRIIGGILLIITFFTLSIILYLIFFGILDSLL